MARKAYMLPLSPGFLLSPILCPRRPVYVCILLLALAGHDLGGLDGAHLGDPAGRGLDLADSTEFIGRVARHANVVGALKDQLDIANLEDLGATLLGVAAGSMENVIDEAISHVQDAL